jgi:hypothetical protein
MINYCNLWQLQSGSKDCVNRRNLSSKKSQSKKSIFFRLLPNRERRYANAMVFMSMMLPLLKRGTKYNWLRGSKNLFKRRKLLSPQGYQIRSANGSQPSMKGKLN